MLLLLIMDNNESLDQIIVKLELQFINYHKELYEKVKYASPFKEINYQTINSESIDVNLLLFLNKNIKRRMALIKLIKLVQDIKLAILIEAGIFEFVLVFSMNKNLIIQLMPAIYNDKVEELCKNLNPDSSVLNKNLIKKVKKELIKPQLLAFLKPQDLYPEKWESIIKKQVIREKKRKNIATTDMYECPKCHERKCQFRELQTRSLDEASIKYISCVNCYHEFKR